MDKTKMALIALICVSVIFMASTIIMYADRNAERLKRTAAQAALADSKAAMSRLEADIESAEKARKGLENRMAVMESEAQGMTRKLKEEGDKTSRIIEKSEKLEKKIEELRGRLNKAETERKDITKKLGSASSELEAKKAYIKELEESGTKSTARLEMLQQRVGVLSSEGDTTALGTLKISGK